MSKPVVGTHAAVDTANVLADLFDFRLVLVQHRRLVLRRQYHAVLGCKIAIAIDDSVPFLPRRPTDGCPFLTAFSAYSICISLPDGLKLKRHSKLKSYPMEQVVFSRGSKTLISCHHLLCFM